MAAVVKITRDPLDDAAIRALVREAPHASDGGVVTFEGVVRDNARNKRIRYLEYDAYTEMAEQQMATIAAEVRASLAHRSRRHRPSHRAAGDWRVQRRRGRRVPPSRRGVRGLPLRD